ncbi:hypothetical protein [Polyangium aurulentum]|uniref:hypothetical protein n=1 Tax=Polyangium aurulentum TaxID=2567896 RepID=UPI0010ADBAAC|nr:hypothetical protein [Polyangium aurulentum]UQA54796.1 hypothetical protein E8A73_025855 [Polyangium aurulentum]
MSDPKNPLPGDQSIDATDVNLVDITPEQMLKLIRIRDGLEGAAANILRLTPDDIDRIGLNPGDVQRAVSLIEQYERIEALLPAAAKLFEMLTETRAVRAHELSLLFGEIAAQARRRGRRDARGGEIMGPLAELFAYQYGPAQKAVATRAKSKTKPSGEGDRNA